MSVEEYKKAIADVFQSGFLKGDIIRKHIKHHLLLDKILPDSASFFLVVEPSTHKYHFMGKQQESVTGYSNEVAIKKGMEFFLECLHPAEVNILLSKIYPKIQRTLAELAKTEDIRKASVQFNYKFKAKSGNYLNLMEHLYVLETDQVGNPSLFLGQIVTLGESENLPLRLTIKMMTGDNSLKTTFTATYNSEISRLAVLTTRELEILHHLAVGKTSKQIGDKLCISNHTVDTHRRKILKKLNCRSVVELSHLAYKNRVL